MNNPSAEKTTCPECGRTIRYSRRTGRLYSHYGGLDFEACAASGAEVCVPEGGPKVVLPSVSRATAATTGRASGKKYYDSTDTNSIRTVSAGLPGHGKRR